MLYSSCQVHDTESDSPAPSLLRGLCHSLVPIGGPGATVFFFFFVAAFNRAGKYRDIRQVEE